MITKQLMVFGTITTVDASWDELKFITDGSTIILKK